MVETPDAIAAAHRRAPWRTVLRLAVSIALVALLAWFYDPHQALGVLTAARWLPLVGGGLVFLAMAALEAVRFTLLMRFPGFGLRRQVRLTLVSGFVAQVTFGTLGGDIYRLEMMRRDGIPPAAAGPWLALVRLMGFAANAVGVVVAAGLPMGAAGEATDARLAPFMTAVAIAAMAVLVGGAVLGFSAWSLRDTGLARRIRRPFAAAAQAVAQGMMTGLAGSAVLSLVIVLMRGEMIRLICLAFGLDIGFAAGLFVASVSAYATMIPVAFGGLGLREGAIAGTLALFGAPATLAITIALAARIVPLLASVAGLAIGWLLGLKHPEAAR